MGKIERGFNALHRRKYITAVRGVLVGVVTGFLVSFFRYSVEAAEKGRGLLFSIRGESVATQVLFIVGIIAAAYLAVIYSLEKEPDCGGSGIPQVKAEMIGELDQNWLRVIFAKLVGGFFAIGIGMSLGREGPSVQLGAMAGKGFARLSRTSNTEEKMLITCGAAAGLAGAFCAPLAGTVFALEELHKNFSTRVLVSAMAASLASNFVATSIFGLAPVFNLAGAKTLPLRLYWILILLGILLGAFGALYNRFTAFVQDLYERLPGVQKRIALVFILSLLLLKFFPYVLGGGASLIDRIGAEEFTLGFLFLLLIIKFLFSVLCFGSGAPGGIFLPLLVMGGLWGGICAGILNVLGFMDVSVTAFVSIGMAGAFTGIVRAPVTGVLLITEMTGGFAHFMPLALVSLFAYMTADLLKCDPIYDQLLKRLLEKRQAARAASVAETGMNAGIGTGLGTASGADAGAPAGTGRGKVFAGKRARGKDKKLLMESAVYVGSMMDGEPVRKMALPAGCLIVSVERGADEQIPDGDTVLKGGDKLLLLVPQSALPRVRRRLERICKVTR